MKICKVNGCDRKMRSNGMCAGHVSRMRRGLSLDGPIIPRDHDYPIADRFWSKVDKSGEGGCWEWTAYRTTTGYGKLQDKGKQVFAHRFSWELHNGPLSPGAVIDHLCYNKGCVNPGHMRECTVAENQQNHPGLRSDNTSGHRGVSLVKRTGKWSVRVTAFGKVHYGGNYTDKAEAIRASNELRARVHYVPEIGTAPAN